MTEVHCIFSLPLLGQSVYLNDVTHSRKPGVGLWIRNQSSMFLLAFIVATLLLGCGLEERPNYVHEVEIAPGRWLSLQERRGKCWFICEWNGKRVFWPGKRNPSHGGEDEMPITLREYEGTLYLIVGNREDIFNVKFVYLKLDESGERFVEIPPKEFPKSIAIENMVGPITRYVGVGDETNVDSWEKLRKLDTEHGYFAWCDTTYIWVELETGLTQQEIRKTLTHEDSLRIRREYFRKYKPVPVPTLVKENN